MHISLIIKKSLNRYDTDSLATIYVRFRDGRKIDSTCQTELSVNPYYWDEKNESIKSKIVCDPETRNKLDEGIRGIKSFIQAEYVANKEHIDKTWLKTTVDKYYHPQKYLTEEEKVKLSGTSFEKLFDEFLEKHKISEVRKKNFRVIKRTLLRYELFIRNTKKGNKKYSIDINEVTKDTLESIWNFFENEHNYYKEYPELYKTIPEKRAPKPRGRNTLIDNFSRIRTFFLWCYNNHKTTNRPFDDFPLEECLYGSPVYISIDERNQIFSTDLSEHPKLAIQRDIFIFQSVIGCRISDLYSLTKNNIVDGAIEYIQHKTKKANPRTIRVPLNEIGKAILDRYKDYEGDHLFPFISDQKYNKAIKEFFKISGIDRMVTIINPLTREPIQKPLYEIATSHTARKTFVGNIYRKVKDPDLVSSLSGHKEGSKAFRRYRDIDEDMKKDLVKLLD